MNATDIKRPKLSTLIILTMVTLMSLNMFLPALPEMAADFDVPYAVMNIALGGYLAAAAVTQLIFGPLSDRYGRRPVLIATMAIFTVASIGGLLATNIWVFLAFRFLQSAVVSGMVLSRAIVRDFASEEEATSLLGYIAMVMALSPMLGPAVGGFMAEWFGWRSIYMLFVGVGAASLYLSWADVNETNLEPTETILAQFKSYPDLFRSRRFWGYSFGMTFCIGGFYAFISGAPQVGEQVFGLTPGLVGAGVGSISCGFMFGNYVAGKFTTRFGIKAIVLWGRYFGLLGPALALSGFLLGLDSLYVYFGGVMFVGFGNGLSLPGANVGVMSVRPRLAGSAAGLSGAMTIAGGAVLTSLTGAILPDSAMVESHLALITLCMVLALISFIYVYRVDAIEGPAKDQ